MAFEQAAGFFLFALVAAATPGPSNVLLTALGAQFGLGRALPCLFGISAGMASLVFATALGLGRFILAAPDILRAIQVGGAAILLWLAWRIATAPVAAAPGGGAPRPPRPVGFLGGALLQWVNPKAWLASAGGLAAHFHPSPADAAPQAAAYAALFVLAALPAGFVWLVFGAAAQGWLDRPSRRRGFKLAMAAALAGSVLLILA